MSLLYKDYRTTPHFAEIAGLALMDCDKPLTFFQAEILFYSRRTEQSQNELEPPAGKVQIEFKGTSFSQLSGLMRKMQDEAG